MDIGPPPERSLSRDMETPVLHDQRRPAHLQRLAAKFKALANSKFGLRESLNDVLGQWNKFVPHDFNRTYFKTFPKGSCAPTSPRVRRK